MSRIWNLGPTLEHWTTLSESTKPIFNRCSRSSALLRQHHRTAGPTRPVPPDLQHSTPPSGTRARPHPTAATTPPPKNTPPATPTAHNGACATTRSPPPAKSQSATPTNSTTSASAAPTNINASPPSSTPHVMTIMRNTGEIIADFTIEPTSTSPSSTPPPEKSCASSTSTHPRLPATTKTKIG